MQVVNLIHNIYYKTGKISNKQIGYLCSLFVRTIGNILIRLIYKLTHNTWHPNIVNSHPMTVISLTSFPKRINKIWIVIESLMRQTEMPDRIVLWLSADQFKCTKIPKSLQKLQQKGLEIRMCESDLRSHKKYYYAFQEFSQDKVITVDDDIIYPSNLVEELNNAYNLYPDCVIARYVHVIHYDKKGTLTPYTRWNNRVIENPSFMNFFGSGGGTLFPVYKMTNDVLDKHIFMILCKTADDIWLNAYARFSGLKIYVPDNISHIIFNIQIRNDERLYCINEGLQDVQIKKVQEFFLSKYGVDPFTKHIK